MEEHNITGPSLLYTELRSQSCDLEDEEMAGSSVVDDDSMLLSQSSNGCDTFQSSTHLNTDSPFTLTTGEDMDTPSTSTANPSTGPSDAFHVQTHLIPQAEEQNELQGLGLNVYNQEDLEQGIIAQVDEVLAKQEEQRIKKLLERQLKSVLDDVSSSRQELVRIGQIIRSLTRCSGELSKENRKQLEAATRQRENKLKQMKKLKAKQAALLAKLDGQDIDPDLASNDEDLKFFNQALSTDTPKETEAEILVKRGEMTPFGTVMKEKSKVQSQPKPIVQPSAPSEFELFLQNKDTVTSKKGKTLKNKSNSFTKCTQQSPTLSKLNQFDLDSPVKHSLKHKRKEISKQKLKPKSAIKRKPSLVKEGSVSNGHISDKDWVPSDGEDGEWKPSSDEDSVTPHKKKKLGVNGVKDKSILEEEELGVIKGNNSIVSSVSRTRDDGNLAFFQKRLKSSRKLEAARKKKQRDEGMSDSEDDEMEFEGGLKVPGTLWNKLYGYQRTGVKWLWELHCQQAGGIVGDEMGLGKTIQTISFLASLKTSKLKQRPFRYVGLGPTIIVCPATVMHQWVREFHKWWPEFRVAILHSSGTHTGSEDHLIHNIVNQHGVLVTSYTTLVHQQDALLHHDWHYIILDEGHKIRNPDAQVTQAVKQFRTPHRIILSGSPIQNNLKELWSLFDFVFPGKLGTLPDFMAHFSIPIVQGGYANASQVQVQTAYKCACILRDTISPYLLRRMKADVKSSVNLPGKSEQVLFCRLTDEQRDVYQEYLESKECNAILAGKYKVFAGLITLRKICNHPDISTGGPRVLVGQSTNGDPTLEYGYWRRSGKLIVVEALLKIWKQQGHRVLLFSQSKQMLDILEGFVKECDYSYLRMDGGTSISARQPLIQKYNSNPTIFVFLLTTRVGGLGVNLTGANRVVIFDPDWNPSTDMQARERAWRIGQNKQVTIYRLLTTGSIEEKIYHRQIFKQFLTNRVLKDPKQRRFFKTNDLFELFTLGDKDDKNGTETEAIFAGTGSEVTVGKNKNRFDEMKKEAIPVNKKVDQIDSVDVERKQKMKEMAKKLSEKIVKDKDNGHTSGKKKKKKKRDKRPKDAEFEGSKIPHLTKLSDHKTSGKDGNADEQLSVQQDDYVLKKLFKKTGIQGALQHDVIVSADKMDYALVEGEAEKVAREAVSALKKSRRHCHTAVSGIPNFTGAPSRPRFGKKKNSLLVDPSKQAAKPSVNGETAEKSADQKVFDGSLAGNRTGVSLVSSATRVVMTSEELLGKMRARQISCEDDVAPTPKNGEDKNIELVTEIRNFIAFQCHVDGQASTQELLDEFGVKLPPGESAKFKAMLNQICDFYHSGDAGVWKLKPAFR